MCLGKGLVSFSMLPYTVTGNLGRLQPVSSMPFMALTQHCLVWRLAMRIAQDLTWRVAETHLSTWWISASCPVFSSLGSKRSAWCMWKSVKRMGITVQTNIQHHSEKKPYPEPVYPEAGFYNSISKTYILLNWSLFCVNRDSCIRGWHCTPKSLVLVSHGWLSLSWLFYMYTVENKDSGDG